MSKKKIILNMISDREYESINDTGNKVTIDMYDGENKNHQSPMELLLSSLASCASVDAILMMKKKKKNILDFKVEAEGERNEGIPSFYKSIHLKFTLTSPDATVEEFQKVITLAVEKYCSVASSLKSEINYSSMVVRQA